MRKVKMAVAALIMSSTLLTGCSSLGMGNKPQSDELVVTAPTQMALLLTRCSNESPKRSIIPEGTFECKNGVCSGKFTVLAEDVFGCQRRFH